VRISWKLLRLQLWTISVVNASIVQKAVTRSRASDAR